MAAIIRTEELTKSFRVVRKEPGIKGSIKSLFNPKYVTKMAVDHISFEVQPGEVVGYIGVNGAGKSTTIKMLTGILLPSSGTISVFGRDPYKERVENAKTIGVVFGQRTQLWWDLPFIESLNLVSKIYEVPKARYRELLDQFVDTLELKEILSVPIRNMSLGQKMRAELAATLIHEPQVVYLDEPTIGLDLLVKEKIRNFIKEQNLERNITVMLTTHDLGDIEELCSRVIIIDEGKIIYDGPIQKIKERFGKYREITFEIKQAIKDISLPDGAEVLDSEPGHLTVRFDRTIATASLVTSSLMSQVEINDFSLSEPDLSSVVKQIYNGALQEGNQ